MEADVQNNSGILLRNSAQGGKKKPIHRKIRNFLRKHVFCEENFHLKTAKIQFPKLLIRLFCSYYGQFSSKINPSNRTLVHQFLNKGRNDHNLKNDVRKLMGYSEKGFSQKLNDENRRIIYKILEKHINEEVILNSRLQRNRFSYMMCSKVYRLRCRNQLSNKCEYR